MEKKLEQKVSQKEKQTKKIIHISFNPKSQSSLWGEKRMIELYKKGTGVKETLLVCLCSY